MATEDFGAPKKVQSTLDLINAEELRRQADLDQTMEQQNAEQIRAAADGFNEGTNPTEDSDKILDALLKAGPAGALDTGESTLGDAQKLNAAEYGQPEYLPGVPPTPAVTNGPPREGHPQKHLPVLPYVKVKTEDWDGNVGLYIIHGYLLSSSLSSPSVSAKAAITPYKDTYISWYCSEEPECRFLDTLIVPIRWGGRGSIKIPDRFWQSVEPNSIRVIGAVAANIPSAISAEVRKEKVHVKVKTPLFVPRPTSIRVRIVGNRLGDFPRWAESTKEKADKNNAFWAQAHEGTGR